MTTKKYKLITFIAHVCAILLIITSIVFLVQCMRSQGIFAVEKLLKLPSPRLGDILYLHVVLNIIIGLLGLCGILSKLKIYMKVFIFFDLASILGTCTYILLVLIVHGSNLQDGISNMGITPINPNTLESLIIFYYPGGHDEFNKVIKYTEKSYYILAGSSVFLFTILLVLSNIGKHICREKEECFVPFIKEAAQVGLSSGSLRVKRVINASLSPERLTTELGSSPIEI